MNHDDGFSTMETVLMLPLITSILLLFVGVGLIFETRIDVAASAGSAARAASLARTPAEAATAARTVVNTTLDGRGIACQGGPTIQVQATAQPGSTTRVTVTCVVALRDLAVLGVPGRVVVTRDAESIVETFKARP